MEKYNELKAILEGCAVDFEKFYKNGNKAAGTRVRKCMNELKKKAQEIRIEVQNMKGQEQSNKSDEEDVAHQTGEGINGEPGNG